MEKLINLLYDIEEKANSILQRANDEKQISDNKLDNNIIQLDKQIADETEQKLNKFKTQINFDLEKEKAQLIIDFQKQQEDLNNYFTNNHDALVNKIFNSIIGA